jgi:hypothetical protein
MGILTVVNLLQYAKALAPIVVTEFGIVIEFRLEQPLKAVTPIVINEVVGIVTEDNPVQL